MSMAASEDRPYDFLFHMGIVMTGRPQGSSYQPPLLELSERQSRSRSADHPDYLSNQSGRPSGGDCRASRRRASSSDSRASAACRARASAWESLLSRLKAGVGLLVRQKIGIRQRIVKPQHAFVQTQVQTQHRALGAPNVTHPS